MELASSGIHYRRVSSTGTSSSSCLDEPLPRSVGLSLLSLFPTSRVSSQQTRSAGQVGAQGRTVDKSRGSPQWDLRRWVRGRRSQVQVRGHERRPGGGLRAQKQHLPVSPPEKELEGLEREIDALFLSGELILLNLRYICILLAWPVFLGFSHLLICTRSRISPTSLAMKSLLPGLAARRGL